MFMKVFFVLATLLFCESAFIYSSFWAPLFNPRILNYRVDINYDSDAGKNSRSEYEKSYGYRGENLIADFGNGRGPPKSQNKEVSRNVKFYYTYPGATNENIDGIDWN